jgi:hypothetical protein
MDILFNIAFFILGWLIGRELLLIGLRKLIMRTANERGIDLDAPETSIPICIVERTEHQLYLYDKKTNKFYCQAETLDELAINLKKNAQINVAFVIELVNDVPKLWLFKDGKSEPAKLNET